MKTKSIVLFLVIPILLLSAGCVPECTPEELSTFDITLLSPGNGAVVHYDDQVHAFEWAHQEACKPSSFFISVVREDGDTQAVGNGDGSLTSLEQGISLDPGFSYQWDVKAVLQLDEGENGGPGYIYSPPSDTWSFTADGLCSAAELEPPVLSSPANGDIIDDSPPPGVDHYIIDWSYPGDCFPETFRYQAASDSNFLNMITSGQVIFKDAYAAAGHDPDIYQADIPVPGCAKIYWRVEARTGNDSGGFSETQDFTYFTDPNCFLNQQPGPVTLIKGFVFADYCKNTRPWIPEGVDIWPPCVFGEPHGVHADGNRNHAAGENETTGESIPFESGIADVVVDLGSGPCPSTGLNQMTTMSNGGYYFMVPSPGEYCLSISKITNPDLDHGIWTKSLTSDPVTQTTITIGDGESLVLQDFGWDQNDYIKINFHVDLLSFCRSGDGKEYLGVAVVEEDSVIPIFARNEDSTWFASKANGELCFISIASGTPQQDPEGLMIYPVQPAPQIEESTAGDQPAGCSSYDTSQSCLAHGCTWIDFASGGTCTKP